MRLAAGAIVLAAMLATGVARAELKEFKDWVVGCDNLRFCTVLGLTPQDDGNVAYIRITRDGAADAKAQGEVVAWADEGTTKLFFTVDGDRAQLPAKTIDGYARATLSDAVLEKLANANEIRVATVAAGGNRVNDPINISPNGAAAALRYMDAEQKRDGGVTALVAKGDKPASDIPAPPAMPQVVALKIENLDPPPTARPTGLGEPDEDLCTRGTPYIAYKLSETQTLWGVCLDLAAYNFTYTYYLAQNGTAKLLTFRMPGAGETSEGLGDGTLTNVWLEEDGRSLHSGGLGRGVGDCGESAEWVWDGAAIQPAGYSAMPQCRGLSPNDWPVLYRAKKESP